MRTAPSEPILGLMPPVFYRTARSAFPYQGHPADRGNVTILGIHGYFTEITTAKRLVAASMPRT